MTAISLYARPTADFSQKLARSLALLKSAAADYLPLTQASSLGAEDMVVTHLLYEAGLLANAAVSVFVLDTGMLHQETLALLSSIEARYNIKVEVYRPDANSTSAFVQDNGVGAMYNSLDLRKQCCHIRKMEPLERALAGKKGWLTGLRREQSAARAEVHDVEQQLITVNGQTVGRAKINPLADWTQGDIWHCIATHAIPYNLLHDQFFPSIGCAPCTRAVTPGEDVRSGRWWWENESAKECGLHVAADGTHEAQEPAAFEPLSSTIPIQEILA